LLQRRRIAKGLKHRSVSLTSGLSWNCILNVKCNFAPYNPASCLRRIIVPHACAISITNASAVATWRRRCSQNLAVAPAGDQAGVEDSYMFACPAGIRLIISLNAPARSTGRIYHARARLYRLLMGSSAPLLRRRILCSLIQLGRRRWPLCAPFYSHPYRVAYTRDWIEHNGTGLSATASMVIIGFAMRIIETITRSCSPPDDREANRSAKSLFRRSRSPTFVSG